MSASYVCPIPATIDATPVAYVATIGKIVMVLPWKVPNEVIVEAVVSVTFQLLSNADRLFLFGELDAVRTILRLFLMAV